MIQGFSGAKSTRCIGFKGTLGRKGKVCKGSKDTDDGGGCDGKDGSDGNGPLSVSQIPGSVGSSHDSCRTEEVCVFIKIKTKFNTKNLSYKEKC